jgi:EF-P beta-lysylation protein EpmB
MQEWQQHLKDCINSSKDLLNAVGIKDCGANDTAVDFPCRVPKRLLARIERGNKQDPVLQQVMVSNLENTLAPGYSADPLAEQAQSPVPGLIRKYRSKVLLMVNGGCAVHCRYCFRRNYDYAEWVPARRQQDRWWAYIQENSEINEVILSGGDPLMHKDSLLAELLENINQLSQIRFVRIHTRLPVVIPERLTTDLIDLLARHRVVMVLHSNHAQEWADKVLQQRLQVLRQKGVLLLNQAVMLAGINDSASAQISLCETLDECGVLPYYVHCLDPVQGAAHFAVPRETAQLIHREMKARLPGYLVPRLVAEEVGADAKVWVNAQG